MIDKKLTTAELESTYELIAAGIDAAGPARAQLFLAKLAFTLANLLGDAAAVAGAIEVAARDL